MRRIAKQLPWLDPANVEPWVRPYITSAREHAADLAIELEGVGSLVGPIAEELATARLVYRGLLQLGLAGDGKALEAARSWLREARQHALTLEALARTNRAERDDGTDQLALARRAFQQQLAERQAAAIDAPSSTTSADAKDPTP